MVTTPRTTSSSCRRAHSTSASSTTRRSCFNGAHENVIVDENDIDTGLSHGTSPNDGNGDGSFTGSPGDNLPGPATVSGDLSGLVRVGADAVDAFNHGTFAFTTDGSKLSDLETIGLKSQGHLLEYAIVDTDPNDGFQILQATTDDHRTVFELKLFSDGHFDFSLFDQVDHDPPFDQDPPGFISQDPTSGGNNFPLSDRNTDLIDNDDPNGHPRILDIDQINFGALIDFSDADHDTVSLDGAFTISIRDDVPKLIHGETIMPDRRRRRHLDAGLQSESRFPGHQPERRQWRWLVYRRPE